MAVPENRLPAHQGTQVAVPVFSFNEIGRMATAMAKSGLFGAKTEDEALVVLMIAQAEGIHPMTAATTYHIMDIQGRKQITMKSNIMVARFQAAGGVVTWEELNDKVARAKFEHRQCPKPVVIEWNEKRATEAGLWNKDMWKKYRQAMLRSRTESEGVRTALPMVIMGKYTPEEFLHMPEDLPESKDGRIDMAGTALLQSLVDEWLQQIKECGTEKDLREVFKGARQEAKDKGDAHAIGVFSLAYDAQLELIREAAAKLKAESQPQGGEQS